jgi:hypothetical protein
MDLLCQTWIGQEGVHGFDCYDDEICCYMFEKDEKVEAKILRQAGEHKVKFKYGPRPKADDLMRGT